MEKIILTITVEIDPSACVTWDQLRRLVDVNTPANGRLVIAPTDHTYPINAEAWGLVGGVTVVAA